MKVHAFRLLPGDDLMGGIEKYIKDHNITAAYVSIIYIFSLYIVIFLDFNAYYYVCWKCKAAKIKTC